MTIREIVGQGFYYARTCRSLWLFGFFVGIASGGSNGGGGGGGDGSAGAGGIAVSGLLSFFATEAVVAAVAFVLVIVAAGFLMRFLSEGALIEGIVRARQGGVMTTREGFRAGWAHWGVLVRIALLYFAAIVGSVALLAAPCVIALRAFGPLGAGLLGMPALLVAVPWLVTLSLVQAFAMRIAVLENRRALDAIGKARLFLHGRLIHGLKLMVAPSSDRSASWSSPSWCLRPSCCCWRRWRWCCLSGPSSSSGGSCCCRRGACSPRCWAPSGRRSGPSAT